MIRLLPLLLLAACDPVWAADFVVTDLDTEAPIADASIALVDCTTDDGAPLDYTAAILTDADGRASVAGLGFTLPRCDFVVAVPGYWQRVASFVDICQGDLDDCARVRTIDVELEPNGR